MVEETQHNDMRSEDNAADENGSQDSTGHVDKKTSMPGSPSTSDGRVPTEVRETAHQANVQQITPPAEDLRGNDHTKIPQDFPKGRHSQEDGPVEIVPSDDDGPGSRASTRSSSFNPSEAPETQTRF